MKLSDLLLNRFLYKQNTQTLETKDAVSTSFENAQAPSTAIASGNTTTDVNNGSVQLNGEVIEPGTIPPETLDISNLGWTNTCAFSVLDADTVQWGAGTFTSASGNAYSIGAGNTGNMSAKTYVYFDINVSTTAYQTTTNVNTPLGVGKVLIAVCQNGGSVATFMPVETTQIVGDNIVANTINASKITAGSITATQISASYVYAGTITANQVTAGTLTGSLVRTSSGSDRVELNATDNALEVYKSGVIRIFLNQDALVVLNASGTSLLFVTASGTSASLDVSSVSGGSIQMNANATGTASLNVGGSTYFFADGTNGVNQSRSILPTANATYDLGSSVRNWNNFFLRDIQQPVLYSGYCSGTTISKTNTSFTLTNPSTGKYTITHNFGTTNYTAVTTALRASGAGAYSTKIEALNSNTLQVTVFDDTGTVQNSDFMFLITKI